LWANYVHKWNYTPARSLLIVETLEELGLNKASAEQVGCREDQRKVIGVGGAEEA
jgi:hypothetical protein